MLGVKALDQLSADSVRKWHRCSRGGNRRRCWMKDEGVSKKGLGVKARFVVVRSLGSLGASFPFPYNQSPCIITPILIIADRLGLYNNSQPYT